MLFDFFDLPSGLQVVPTSRMPTISYNHAQRYGRVMSNSAANTTRLRNLTQFACANQINQIDRYVYVRKFDLIEPRETLSSAFANGV